MPFVTLFQLDETVPEGLPQSEMAAVISKEAPDSGRCGPEPKALSRCTTALTGRTCSRRLP